MSRILQSKSKISRKYGVNLWGKANDAFIKKPYIPGQHGGKVMRISKTYRKQLVDLEAIRSTTTPLNNSYTSLFLLTMCLLLVVGIFQCGGHFHKIAPSN